MGVWNVVSAVCLIIMLAVVLSAAIRWWLGSYRSFSAYIDVTVSHHDGGMRIRLQNIGMTDCGIIRILVRNLTLRLPDDMPSRRMLRPGQAVLFEVDDWPSGAEIIPMYVSYDNPKVVRLARFGRNFWSEDGLDDISLMSVRTPWGRKNMWYSLGTYPVFEHSGPGSRLRLVRLDSKDGNRTLRSLIQLLVERDGYTTAVERRSNFLP